MKLLKIALCAVIIAAIAALTGAVIIPDEAENKLAELGYLSFSEEEDKDAVKEAVRNFELVNGLIADGASDDIMLAKLEKVYNEAPKTEITAESADIFSDTGIFSKKVGTLKKGDLCVVLGTEEVSGITWYNIGHGTLKGWISGEKAEYTEPNFAVRYFTAAIVDVPALDVRKGAGAENPKLTTLRKGAVVSVKTSQEVSGVTWYCYEIDSEEHWINGNYVTVLNCVAENSGELITAKPAVTTAIITTTAATAATTAAETASESDKEIEYTDSVFAHSDEYRLGRYYDALCRVQKTGDLRTDIAAVALSQTGYHEGSSISDVSGDSDGSENFTEYGVNYGTPDDYWCAMFIWWCARQAGVQETIIPKTEWAKVATFGCDYKRFESNAKVQTGDILFIDNSGDQYEDHVALVVSVTEDTITTVEGNTSNSVKQRTYSLISGESQWGDAKIVYIGYPAYEGKNTEKDKYKTTYIRLSSEKSCYSAPDGQYRGEVEEGEYLLLNEGKVGDVRWYQIAIGVDSRWVKEGRGVKKVTRDKAPISSIETTAAAVTTTTTTTTTAATTAHTEPTEAPAPPKKTEAKVRFAKVNANVLNLRCGPDITYAKIAVTEKDSEYAVAGSKTVSDLTWYRLIYKGECLWASGEYLTIREVVTEVDYVDMASYNTDEPCYLSRTAVVNADASIMYAKADPSSAPLAVLKKGITYTVVGSGSRGSTTWHKINVDGIEGYISRYEMTLTNHYTEIPNRDFTKKTPVIYLSPSKQGSNPYIIGKTSEKAEMEALGDVIFEKLKAYDCVVHLAPKDYSLEKRAEHAYSLDTDIYIAIHSNATGNKTVHYGPSAYYFPGCEQSRIYAESIVNSLNKVAPLGTNLNAQVLSGMNLAGGCGYAEVREPGKLGMIGVLVETDFHDYAPTAQWLIDEKETAADAYVESLVNAFGLRLKEIDQSEQDAA